jgi:uncharacterized protein DUF3800
MQTDDELKFANDWLLVFMDETGHETFAGDHPYFAVGGCGILGEHHAAVNAQWRDLRRAINGDPDLPLHAADLAYSPENFAALTEFFKLPSFARFGVGASSKTSFAVDMHTMAPVMVMLKQHIARLVSVVPCTHVALIFESSDRGDPLVRQYFGELGLRATDIDIPIEHCFMPKSSREPALELADFVASAAGSQTQRYHRGQTGFARDYEAVFHAFPVPMSQFFHIAGVGGSREDQEAWVEGVKRRE